MPKDLEIEHVALSVADPVKVAQWYAKHLEMQIVRALDKSPYTQFLADSAGHVMLEIYNNPAVTVPDYPKVHPLLLHVAFSVSDVKGTRQRLLDAGATAEGGVDVLPNGDEMTMLRDPWGLPIQLVRRAQAMI